MSMIEMQRLLSRILTDADFRQVFVNDPQEACGAYVLTSKEADSLKAIDRVRMESYALMLRDGRVGLGLKAFPVTSRLLPPDFHNFSVRYVSEYPPVPGPGAPMLLEAMTLYRFIAGLVAEGSLDVPYLREVLEYEKNLFLIGNDLEIAALANACAAANACLPEDLTEDEVRHLKPCSDGHVLVSRFGLNVIELLSHLSKGRTPEACPEEETYILFLKIPHHAGVSISRLNKVTANLLGLCSGERTTAELLAELASDAGITSDAGKAELAVRCVGMLKQLVKSNIITFRQ
jgi:hypothetical protein